MPGHSDAKNDFMQLLTRCCQRRTTYAQPPDGDKRRRQREFCEHGWLGRQITGLYRRSDECRVAGAGAVRRHAMIM